MRGPSKTDDINEYGEKITESPRVTLRLRQETVDYVLEKQRELQLSTPQQAIIELVRRAEVTDELRRIYRQAATVQSASLRKRVSAVEDKYEKHAWEFRKLRVIEAEVKANTESIQQLRTELADLKLLVETEMKERIILSREAAEVRLGRPRTCQGRPRRRRVPEQRTSIYLDTCTALVQRGVAVAEEHVPYNIGSVVTKENPGIKNLKNQNRVKKQEW